MDPVITGALISGGASLLGGMLSSSSGSKANAASLAWQKELANNQIWMRTQDAKRSGISPLAALGANLYQGSWTPTGSSMGDAVAAAGSALGDGISRAGQMREARKAQAVQDARLDAESKARIFESQTQGLKNLAERDFALEQEKASKFARIGQLVNTVQPMPDDKYDPTTSRVTGNAWEARVPFISPLLEMFGLPEVTISSDGLSPSGEFWEGRYQEGGNFLSLAQMAEDLGLHKLALHFASLPAVSALQTVRSAAPYIKQGARYRRQFPPIRGPKY